jgi:hypothetical protein
MKLGKLAEHYYTAAEARKVLGVTPETFQYWGRDGRIRRIYLPGRKQPVYSKSEINKMAQQTEAFLIAQAEETGFRKATLEDQEEEKQLAVLAFGQGTLLVPREEFLKKNPDTDYHLYRQGRLVAYMNIFPLKKETLERFMQGKIRGYDITPDDIEQFIPGKPTECLIMDAVTIPSEPPRTRVAYSASMISNFIDVLNEWGNRGIEITKLWSVGNTPAGQNILRSAGFKEIKNPNYKTGPGRIPFELDVANSDAKILRQYKVNLAQWKARQEAQKSDDPQWRKSRKSKETVETINS